MKINIDKEVEAIMNYAKQDGWDDVFNEDSVRKSLEELSKMVEATPKEKAKMLSEIGEVVGQKLVVDFNKYKKYPEFQENLSKLSKIKTRKHE
jgi:hypothetical protein